MTDTERPDYLCADCDWIGSPAEAPDECPSCGSADVSIMEDVGR